MIDKRYGERMAQASRRKNLIFHALLNERHEKYRIEAGFEDAILQVNCIFVFCAKIVILYYLVCSLSFEPEKSFKCCDKEYEISGVIYNRFIIV